MADGLMQLSGRFKVPAPVIVRLHAVSVEDVVMGPWFDHVPVLFVPVRLLPITRVPAHVVELLVTTRKLLAADVSTPFVPTPMYTALLMLLLQTRRSSMAEP
jgi:hypothetical protein